MKIKDIVDLKGCYSARDVGEKEIELDEGKIRSIVDNWENDMQLKGYQGRDIRDLEELIGALAKADVIKVKEER